ncbi:MAG: membrane bound O-acyl transferase family [Trebouxia sp. A1-2]|nr:MAG: membrane bound O-acyl transferase family [Trebouxia sp. A1-2]
MSGVPPFQWENDLSAIIGLTVSEFRFAISFFLSVFISWCWRFVPTSQGRHIYAVVTGFCLIYYPFGNGCFHALVPSTLTYAIMRYMRPQAASLAWLINFCYLIACHVSSASGTAWKEGHMDFTGAQMVLTLKMISAAVCYHDGLMPAQELTPYQEARKLVAMPSPLEWLSYIFASGNLLAGPFFELRDYRDYIQRQGAWAGAFPSGLLPGVVRLLKALLCMAFHLRMTQGFNASTLESAWYYSQPLWSRIVVLYLVPTIYRYKYYFAWAVAESGLTVSGFNYNGKSDRGSYQWDRYVNTRIRHVEFQTSLAKLPEHWNVCTGLFLRQYVYERLTVKGKPPTFFTLIVTQLVSGIWHGLFPGYVLFFISSALMFQSSKVLYRYERNWPKQVQNFPLWVVAKWAYTAFCLNYCASAFMILTFKESLAVWRSISFLGHFLMIALILVSVVATKNPQEVHACCQT